MEHVDEYSDAMLTAMDLVWGEGFMAPGGPGNVSQMLRGLETRGRHLLDVGCGQGAPACLMASEHGATVMGIDLEAHLVRRAAARAQRLGLEGAVEFQHVTVGPLAFADDSFDIVTISGALTQIEDKLDMLSECFRVLKPGGAISCYDWMTPGGSPGPEMLQWFDLEGLTYALQTPEQHHVLLESAGFECVAQRDKSAWYCKQAGVEYARMQGALGDSLRQVLGVDEASRFIEAWRLLVRLCDKGHLLQVYTQARRSF